MNKKTNIKPWRPLTRRLRRKIVRDNLEPFIAAQRTCEQILDLGCGNSRYIEHFPNRVGLDFVKGEGVNIIADAHHLPLRSATFSMVLTTEMLEHVQDPQRVVDEIERIVKPGGQVILTTRFVFPIHESPFDFYRFTKYGLKYLFRKWAQVEVTPDARPFESIGALFQRMAYQSDFYGSKFTTLFCLLIAHSLQWGDKLVKKQYGNYGRTVVENEIISNGYYVMAKKQ
jgi:ubiquinone/menaquinone biosynthesis C-methylase UbiE